MSAQRRPGSLPPRPTGRPPLIVRVDPELHEAIPNVARTAGLEVADWHRAQLAAGVRQAPIADLMSAAEQAALMAHEAFPNDRKARALLMAALLGELLAEG